MGWTPPDGICVPRWRCRTATEGGVHGASYHEMARIIWALLVKGGTYRTPAVAA